MPVPADVKARALYIYENYAATSAPGHVVAPEDVDARALYVYENYAATSTAGRVQQPADVDARILYAYLNIGHDRDPTNVLLRALYLYLAYTNGEIFPWIMDIQPREQYVNGQVDIFGDGFGATAAAEGGTVRLGMYDPTQVGPGQAMGVVSWQSRSPGLHPANSGLPIQKAITATVPDPAASGLVSVEETT